MRYKKAKRRWQKLKVKRLTVPFDPIIDPPFNVNDLLRLACHKLAGALCKITKQYGFTVHLAWMYPKGEEAFDVSTGIHLNKKKRNEVGMKY